MAMEQITADQHLNKVANGEKVSDRHLASQPCDQKNNYGNRGLLRALRRCNRKNNLRKSDGDDDGSNNNSNMEKENSASRSISSTAGLTIRSWSDLPKDVVEQIVEKIIYHADLHCFSAVCKPWRSVVSANSNRLPRSLPLIHCPPGQLTLPLLMRSHRIDADSQEYRCLADGKVYGEFLPELKNKRIAGSSEGWFVIVGIDEEEINLLNPFTRAQIRLPSVTSFLIPRFWNMPHVEKEPPKTFAYIRKAILCQDPYSSGNNYVVLAIVSNAEVLAYWRAGDSEWTNIKHSPRSIKDVIYYNGKVYAVCSPGIVVVFDHIGPNAKVSVVGGRRDIGGYTQYLVESLGGELLLVVRKAIVKMVRKHIYKQKTFGFDVYKLAEGEGELSRQVYVTFDQEFVAELVRSEWVKVDSLGDEMFFLGCNKSISIPSQLFQQCKGNCIYYSDDPGSEIYYLRDFDPIPAELHHDIGVYNMEDRSISHYESDAQRFIMPPIWVTPNPW